MQVGIFEVYLIKSSIYLLAFYLFNKLLISRDTMHHLSRYVWLTTAIASLILPFWVLNFEPQITQIAQTTDFSPIPYYSIGAVQSDPIPELPQYSVLDYITTIVFVIYLLGALTTLVIKSRDYIKLLRLILPKSHRRFNPKYQELISECEKATGVNSKVHYIIHQETLSPFSWMNYVVISEQDMEDSGSREILLHELSHIIMRHSWDIIFLDLLTIFMWFNPTAWLIKREMQLVQEYLADQNVLDNGADARTYQLLLIKKAIGTRHYTMSNSLNHSNLKNRITMMMKKRSSKWVMAKSLYTLPVALIALSAYGSSTISSRVDEISDSKFTNLFALEQTNAENSLPELPKKQPITFDTLYVVENENGGIGQATTNKAELTQPASLTISITPPDNYEDSVYTNCDVMPLPTFIKEEATPSDFRVWMSEQLKSDGKSSGRLIASFVIERNGSLSNATIVKSVSEEMDKQVINILNRSGKWTPASHNGKTVRASYMFPIQFETTDKRRESSTQNNSSYVPKEGEYIFTEAYMESPATESKYEATVTYNTYNEVSSSYSVPILDHEKFDTDFSNARFANVFKKIPNSSYLQALMKEEFGENNDATLIILCKVKEVITGSATSSNSGYQELHPVAGNYTANNENTVTGSDKAYYISNKLDKEVETITADDVQGIAVDKEKMTLELTLK